MATTSRDHGERGPAPPTDQSSVAPSVAAPGHSPDQVARSDATYRGTEPAAGQPAGTVLELVDRATDHLSKALLLLLLVCVPLLITYSPAIIAVFLTASGAGSHALTYVMIGNVVTSSSFNTAIIITLRKMLKGLKIPVQGDGSPPSTHP